MKHFLAFVAARLPSMGRGRELLAGHMSNEEDLPHVAAVLGGAIQVLPHFHVEPMRSFGTGEAVLQVYELRFGNKMQRCHLTPSHHTFMPLAQIT